MKNINKLETNKWLTYLIKMDDLVLSNEKILDSLKKFWNDVVSKLDDNQYILIQFKIVDVGAGYKSISYVQRVNKKDLSSLINIFIEF
jgi:hypothetical protein